MVGHMSEEEFVKDDSGKVDLTLLPFDSLEEVAKVLQMGADKYSRDNWKNCKDPGRYRAALLRHMSALLQGEDIDPESGICHAAHIACNSLFLVHFDKAGG